MIPPTARTRNTPTPEFATAMFLLALILPTLPACAAGQTPADPSNQGNVAMQTKTGSAPAPTPAPAPVPLYRDATQPVEARAADLLSRMTVEEKVGQLQSQMFIQPNPAARRPEVGHVRNPAHFAHTAERRATPAECARLINADQKVAVEGSRLGIPVLENGEALHGALWGDATCYPQSIALAAMWDTELMAEAARCIAKETRVVGVRQVFSPVVNIARDCRWGRAQETYGEDPYLSSRMAVEYVKALEAEGVVATTKHFAANVGDGGRDSHPIHFDERLLREIYFPAFQASVEEGGARGIMPAYNSIDGLPCACNPWLLRHMLREEWGFRGIVVSDYGAVPGLVHAHRVAADGPEAAKLAIEAGLDVDLPNGGGDLLGLVKSGRLAESTLNETVARVLRLKFELGLFDKPYSDPDAAQALVRCEPHREVALRAARKCMTLLKNDKTTLPLSKNLKTLGVFGPTRDLPNLGDYSAPYGGWRDARDTPLQALRRLAPAGMKVLSPGSDDDPVAAAKQCDAALVFTGIHEDEGGDRSLIGLPGGNDGPRARVQAQASRDHAVIVDENRTVIAPDDQVALIKALAATGVPVVVVLINGSAVTMQEWIGSVPAVLEAWYPGEEGSRAIVETLFGDNNPAGRLPVTFPKSVGQVPIYYNLKPSGRGYGYNDDDGRPQFPFGYGLSYTSFTYENLQFSAAEIPGNGSVEVACDVTNTGDRAGDEVVQLYLRDDVSSVARPMKELKGFARVSLAPGQKKRVSFTLGSKQLAMWNRDMKWVVEPGRFTVMVGASSDDIRLEGTFRVSK